VRPLNNKCPKIAEIQLTNKVGEDNTDGTSTHCVDSSNHADSVDRHDLVTPAVGGLGPLDRGVGPPTWLVPVRRSPEYAPLIGWTEAPFWLLCPARSQSQLFTWSDKDVSAVLRVVDCVISDLRDLCCYDEFVDMPRKCPAMSDVEPSDSESSSAESEAGDSPASATQSTGAPVADPVPATAGQDPVESVGVASTAPVSGGVVAGGRQLRRRGCKPNPPKPKYVSRTCGLCDHPHVFATRKGLNKHSTACHGQYFSLAGNCFVPIRESDLRSWMDKLRGAQQHRWPHGSGPRS